MGLTQGLIVSDDRTRTLVVLSETNVYTVSRLLFFLFLLFLSVFLLNVANSHFVDFVASLFILNFEPSFKKPSSHNDENS